MISLQSKGLSRVLSNTTIQKHQPLALSLLYGSTLISIHDYWKNHSFDYRDFCWQSNVSAFQRARGSPIKYGDQILRLLEAVHLPTEVSVFHCKGHQKGSTGVARRNKAADQGAKRATLQNNALIGVATLVPQTNLPETPSYPEGETLKSKSEDFQEDHMG